MGRTKTIDDDELLRIAREMFRTHGHTVPTREIARAAKISQAVLYQRFGSKDDLFLRAMTPAPPDVAALLGPYPPRSARADLRRIADRLATFFEGEMPSLVQVLAYPDLRGDRLLRWHAHLPILPISTGLAARFRQLRADGLIGELDPMAAATTLITAVHTIALVLMMFGGSHVEFRARQLDALIATIWTGFSPR